MGNIPEIVLFESWS